MVTTHDGRQPIPFIKRVRIQNYRSIADCDVTLGPLTVLVGFNAAGKSNLLDALSFVSEALAVGPNQALAARGGIDELLRRSTEPVESFQIRLDMVLPPDLATSDAAPATAIYELKIARSSVGVSGALLREMARVDLPAGPVQFDNDAVVQQSGPMALQFYAINETAFARIATALLLAVVYDLDTDVLRAIDEETRPQLLLGSSGGHLGRVLGALERDHPAIKQRLDAYLSALVANAAGIDEQPEGRYSTVAARFVTGGDRHLDDHTEVFNRESLSEGTLRAAGVLAALFQPAALNGEIPLVAIEEPEKALHPATVDALYEALTDAAEHTQVIVTTQSSDLLESEYADLSHIRVVTNSGGTTHVGPVDGAGRSLVAQKRMTIGELHRSGRMLPEQIGYPAEEQP